MLHKCMRFLSLVTVCMVLNPKWPFAWGISTACFEDQSELSSVTVQALSDCFIYPLDKRRTLLSSIVINFQPVIFPCYQMKMSASIVLSSPYKSLPWFLCNSVCSMLYYYFIAVIFSETKPPSAGAVSPITIEGGSITNLIPKELLPEWFRVTFV